MQIVKNFLGVPMKDGNMLLIHTLLGTVHVVDPAEYRCFLKWKACGDIEASSDMEKAFLNQLKATCFIVDSAEIEAELELQVLLKSKKIHNNRVQQISNVMFVLT